MSDHSRLALLATDAQLVVEPELLEKAHLVLRHVESEGTSGMYDWFFGKFRAWCNRKGMGCLPASACTVERFFLELDARYEAQSLKHFRTAIRMRHLRNRHPDPTTGGVISATIEARLRTGTVSHRKVLYLEDLFHVVDTIGTSGLADLRDRALLLNGYLAPLQLRHIQNLERERIVFRADDMLFYVNDRRRTAVALRRGADTRFCPVANLHTYLRCAGIESGPVFVECRYGEPRRTSGLRIPSLLKILRTRFAAAGLDDVRDYTTDSLLAGFVVSGHEAGVRITDLMVRTGLKAASVERYRKFVRSNHPLPATYLGF